MQTSHSAVSKRKALRLLAQGFSFGDFGGYGMNIWRWSKQILCSGPVGDRVSLRQAIAIFCPVYVQGNFHVKRVPVIGIMGVTRMRRKLKEGNHCIRSSFVEEYRENFSDTQLFLRTCHQIILRKHDSERAFFAGIRILCV